MRTLQPDHIEAPLKVREEFVLAFFDEGSVGAHRVDAWVGGYPPPPLPGDIFGSLDLPTIWVGGSLTSPPPIPLWPSKKT